MALVRGFTPAEFRGATLGIIGPFTVTATLPSTLTGAVGGVQIALPTGLNLLPGDLLFVLSPITSRVTVEVQVDDATHISLIASNGSAGTFNPGALSYTVWGFRPKTA